MKILLLCNRLPFPASDGGSIAISNMAYSLIAQGNQIKILAFNTSKHHIQQNQLPQEVIENFNPTTVDLDNSVKMIGALKCLISGKSYHVERFISTAFQNKLQEILQAENFDIIQLESLYLAPYAPVIRKYSSATLVMRAHNAEFKIWERLAETTPFGPKKWYLKILARQLKTFELKNLSAYDGIVSITPEDKALFLSYGCKTPIHITPIGVNPDEYPLSPAPQKNQTLRLFHLGSMDWMPNLEAMQWFLEKVWPQIFQSFPYIHLYMAGKNMPEWIKQKENERLHIIGEVKDAKTFMAENDIMIVPLLSGSGMRVKIIEGMAMGKPIISTSIGAEGIEYTKDENILIADTAEEFIISIQKCMQNSDLMQTLGKNAHALVSEKYNNTLLAHKLTEFYEDLRSQKR